MTLREEIQKATQQRHNERFWDNVILDTCIFVTAILAVLTIYILIYG